MGVTKTDTVEAVIKKTTQHVEIVDDYTVIFHLQQVVPEFVENISSIQDLPMESKARWDAGGKDLYGQKVVSTGPFEFVERKLGIARARRAQRSSALRQLGEGPYHSKRSEDHATRDY